jgi:hypothetical protein
VTAVKFLSTCRRTLSSSSIGGPPTTTIPLVVSSPAFGQGQHLVLEKYVSRTSPTSVYNRVLS